MPTTTVLKIYSRFLKVEPDKKEELVDALISKEAWDDAAFWLVQIINDEYFTSSNKKVWFAEKY